MGASSSQHSSALATFPMCVEKQRAWLLTLGWPGWLGSQEWHTSKGRGRGGGKIAGASSENINPSIWKVMAVFEISPYRSILSPGQGACAGGVRMGWGRAPCAAPRLCPPAVPPRAGQRGRGRPPRRDAAPEPPPRVPSLHPELTGFRGRVESWVVFFFPLVFVLF